MSLKSWRVILIIEKFYQWWIKSGKTTISSTRRVRVQNILKWIRLRSCSKSTNSPTIDPQRSKNGKLRARAGHRRSICSLTPIDLWSGVPPLNVPINWQRPSGCYNINIFIIQISGRQESSTYPSDMASDCRAICLTSEMCCCNNCSSKKPLKVRGFQHDSCEPVEGNE